MPEVEVTSAELRGDVPPVCICCGAPAAARLRFRLQRPRNGGAGLSAGDTDTGAIGLVSLAVTLAETVAERSSPVLPVSLPLCMDHEAARRRRARIIRGLGVVAVLLMVLGASAAVLAVLMPPRGLWSEFLIDAVVAVAPLALGIAVIAWWATWQPVQVRFGPPLILTGVHTAFIEALKQYRTQCDEASEASVRPLSDNKW